MINPFWRGVLYGACPLLIWSIFLGASMNSSQFSAGVFGFMLACLLFMGVGLWVTIKHHDWTKERLPTPRLPNAPYPSPTPSPTPKKGDVGDGLPTGVTFPLSKDAE